MRATSAGVTTKPTILMHSMAVAETCANCGHNRLSHRHNACLVPNCSCRGPQHYVMPSRQTVDVRANLIAGWRD